MKQLIILFASMTFFSSQAFAKEKKFCGKRDGTAGNAYLVDKKGREVITLAVQGEGDSLLMQVDQLIGKNSGVKGEKGSQNGKHYCVVAEMGESDNPIKIVRAWIQK